ncbi:transglycosylase SLT domain-containing protein [Rhizosaccharibacter radicis]|uniref:Lytic transglycosylase domain-containing protein n=1 Tax=Rhizosaccharibacter radicis TaxID=2782605 RepID=A0ABT1VV83_9PROT|nr:lytic transglycosylase domain-containing protein [Acetobacteraceae bacterium KSS12]
MTLPSPAMSLRIRRSATAPTFPSPSDPAAGKDTGRRRPLCRQGAAMALAGATLLAGCSARPAQMPASPPTALVAGTAATAGAAGDPVAAKLAVYLELLTPGTPPPGSAARIDAFLAANPGWPNRPTLIQRLNDAVANETDPSVLGPICGRDLLSNGAALARCALLAAPPTATPSPALPGSTAAPPALLPDGSAPLPPRPAPGPDASAPVAPFSAAGIAQLPPALLERVRRSWRDSNDSPAQAALFLRLWSQALRPPDHWARFDRLEWAGNLPAAARMLPLLSPDRRPLATARLALHRRDAGADGLAAALPPTDAADPALQLDLVRWLRRNDRIADSIAAWNNGALAAERTAPGPRLPAFWSERDALSRDMLMPGAPATAQDALRLAEDPFQRDDVPRFDSAFLSGFILLRRLHQPADAEQRFLTLTSSRSVLTRSRGWFWLGEARSVRGDTAGAQAAFEEAAGLPTTFYGQLSLARLRGASDDAVLDAPHRDPGYADALHDRLAALRDPDWSTADAVRFTGLELARAATLLVGWNDPRHARAFLLRLDADATSDTDHALAASLADRLGLPDVGVAIARSAGRHGLVLRQSGWPRPFAPPPAAGEDLPPGLALGIMRQESSFDPGITSPAGARGLMQLMPGTARDVARSLPGSGGTDGTAAGLYDPDANIRLGSAYLSSLLRRFGGTVPYAVAAYNAGPHRVDQWLAQNGDPARDPGTAGGASTPMIDWIELIPFAETRNYVQRVTENTAIYADGDGSTS